MRMFKMALYIVKYSRKNSKIALNNYRNSKHRSACNLKLAIRQNPLSFAKIIFYFFRFYKS